MKKKETQRHKGQMVTSSLPHHRVPPYSQSATIPEKAQPSKEEQMTRVLLQMEHIIQLLARSTSLLLAIINCIATHDVVTTLLLLGIATNTLSVREAIEALLFYLQSRP